MLENQSEQTSDKELVVDILNLQKSFGGEMVLRDLNLQVKEGQHLAVLGPGGCGKSTLLKIMTGVVKHDSGTVSILGKKPHELSRTERRDLLSLVGMAFQQGALFDFMTVKENILFALENMTDMASEDREKTIAQFLEGVKLPQAGEKLPSELSGGMRRRVGIVRALVTKPKLALLDEPTAGLDPVTTTVVIDMIHRLSRQTGSTLICVTSSVEVAFTFAREVAILKDGSIIGRGTWEELHQLGDSWLNHFLDARDFVPPNPNDGE